MSSRKLFCLLTLIVSGKDGNFANLIQNKAQIIDKLKLELFYIKCEFTLIAVV